MNYIEKVLFEKTKEFQEGQIYSDQWKFAKSYLPKVLDTISHVFPHYSLHNSTHSEAIINNIVRIVGTKSIDGLSVVDLWLILAAAYYHDSGMIVSGSDKIAFLKEGSDFVKFVREKQEDASSPMNQYANMFEIKEEKIYYKNEQLTHETYEGARYLLADYVRDSHAERSSKHIESDESLHFPGDPIPERIIGILKSICSCHTSDISKVMDLQLVETSGCGIEDCHPRFVAAMLRLGDLLDVDSNRVSEVLLSTLGCIPSDSKYYNISNRSITHIRIDNSVVEITAECNDYHVADLINKWFQWLNDELVFYMKQWHHIIPFEGFAYLPTVGDLKVNLLDYDTLDGKKRPSFEIDSSKAIELLQGAGLYNDSCECIRELLQNSVDATYLRVYKENKGISSLEEFKKRCNDYPITVKLERLKNASNKNVDGKTLWAIEIIDQGIGMTKEDLNYLSKTGSSEKNKEKKNLIQSVPEIMWPSGTFGIGFQSVFLITNKVDIVTRKINKDNYVKAQLFNPSGKDKGAILIRSVNKEDVDFGTRISFSFNDDEKGRHIICNDDLFSMAKFRSFDFAKNKDVNFLSMKVMDEVARFANGTFVPVEFILEGDNKKQFMKNDKIEFGKIDNETGIQLYLEKTVRTTGIENDSKIYFRNQWVRDYYFSLDYLAFHINILKGTAKEILTLNRNEIRQEYKPILRENILKSVIRYLNSNIDSFDDVRKQLASMLIESRWDFIKEHNIQGIKRRNYWGEFELTVNKTDTNEKIKIPMEKLFTSTTIEKVIKEDAPNSLVFNLDGIKYDLSIDYDFNYSMSDFIIMMAQRKGYTPMLKKGGYILEVKERDIWENNSEAKEDYMFDYLRNGPRARGLFPCGKEYMVLAVKEKNFEQYYNFPGDDLNLSSMICPYVRKFDIENSEDAIRLEYDVDEEVYNTVYENRVDLNTTKEQIIEAYDSFKKQWDKVVSAVNIKAEKESPSTNRCHRYRIWV